MRIRRAFIVYRRQAGKKKSTYYAAFLDAAGRYNIRRALRDDQGLPVTSRGPAEEIARGMLAEIAPAGSSDTLAGYLSSFWAEDGAYAAARGARGSVLSRAYLANSRGAIERHVRPYLEAQHPGILLARTTPAVLEGLVMHLHAGGKLGARTVNAVRQAVAVPLAEAFRLGKIASNPAARVGKLAEKKAEREILTPAEVRSFFAVKWDDPRLCAINFLAATTGLRLGECLGLQHGDILEGAVKVAHNWQWREGLKAPKWGSTRMVPLPAATEAALRELMAANPWGNAFVFYGSSAEYPVAKKLVETSFNDALAKMKPPIKEAERRRRRLTFHSWRHFYDSMLSGRIGPESRRKLTGHASEEMDKLYLHVTEEERKAVAEIAAGIGSAT